MRGSWCEGHRERGEAAVSSDCERLERRDEEMKVCQEVEL